MTFIDTGKEKMKMNTDFVRARAAILATIALALGASAAVAKDVKLSLTGSEETPPVTTSATATGTLKIAKDKSVSGSIKTSGIEGTAAHIHVGAPGQSGPPIITLVKGADGSWSVPPDSKLTDEQYASFKSGNLYVNVHSAEHKPGEIRAQLKP
jgi:CHRD domain